MQEEKSHNTEGKFGGVITCLLTLCTSLYIPLCYPERGEGWVQILEAYKRLLWEPQSLEFE